jgi:hypothetical protein
MNRNEPQAVILLIMADRTSLNVIGAPAGNQCGECTACCDVLGIEELGKPFYSRCKHLAGGGCGIYQDPNRPVACGTFRCAWHAGILGDGIDRRPDRCGLMFDINPQAVPQVLNVWEVIPGALNQDRLQYLIKKMRDHKKVRSLRFGRPAVILYPYGAKQGLRFDVSEDYAGWTPPVSPTLPIRPVGPQYPDQAWFAGEVEPLRMPVNSTNGRPDDETPKSES